MFLATFRLRECCRKFARARARSDGSGVGGEFEKSLSPQRGRVYRFEKSFRFFGVWNCACALNGTHHLARSNALLHQDSLKLLKLWGANDWVLECAGILSATSVGLLGGAIAFLGWVMGAQGILKAVRVLSPLFESCAGHGGYGFSAALFGGFARILSGALGRNSA